MSIINTITDSIKFKSIKSKIDKKEFTRSGLISVDTKYGNYRFGYIADPITHAATLVAYHDGKNMGLTTTTKDILTRLYNTAMFHSL